MSRFFTKTFTRFLFGFLAILAVALGVMIGAGVWSNSQTSPVDNLAQPQ